MSKTQIIQEIAEISGASQKKSSEILTAVLNGIKSSLTSGEKVQFIGFGTFSVSERKATTGRNPQTGAEIQIPARKVVKFSPGKDLKDSVN